MSLCKETLRAYRLNT